MLQKRGDFRKVYDDGFPEPKYRVGRGRGIFKEWFWTIPNGRGKWEDTLGLVVAHQRVLYQEVKAGSKGTSALGYAKDFALTMDKV